MKVSEAIDQLEIGDTVWAKATVNAINFEGGYIRAENTKTSIYLDGNAEISLEELREDKVEVPDFVAEKMKYYESALWMLASEYFDSSSEIDSDELANWIDQNSEKFFRAWLDGYTVKPKRWVVKNEEGCYFVAFSKYAKTPFEGVFSASVTNLVTFDDKAKAEAVAVLVEGSVEEV